AQDKAFQEFLKLTKNNHSAMKRLIHRKGIAGFSEDVGRVVANFVYSNARAGAMGLNAGKMETAIGKIPKEQGELKDLAMGLRDYIRDPQEEGQAVRGMLFAQYLGGSIASAFVNTTQPFAVTLPWLSQYGGMKKAGAQLARALKDMGRSVADKGFKYEADLAKALQSAEDDGVVSPQEIHQLMAQARGAGMLRSGDGTKAGDLRAKAGNLWEQGKVLWGQPFALAEQFNRRSTFIASYRIAKDQGMADPAAFARKAVLETQFVYSKANKPKWARGAVGGTLFTFKTYSVSYLELMQRMWSQGGPEGKRAVGWAVAMLLLMSGAGGVPFMEDAEDLIDGAGQMMGYNISAKQWRKELLANVVGKELGEFMEQGLSGLPGAPIDVSGRLGMGNLLPGTGLFLNKPNRERDLMEIVGPAGDLVARGFTGARKLLGGDVAGAALEISPTAVRNLAKGADMAATGMYRDTKGYKVIDTTLAEAAAKAIGFQPKSVAEVQEANSFMQRSKSFYTQTSSDIKAQWADALFRKDEAAVQRVRERLADWNRDNPEQP
ncbi:PLxRFG domain-containing protein, partial [Comamonas thiooxydans]|uniref:PLxRFG domain-containing protein n=1 Tax=Comamonas thiooxydans TaxID=363952 RepID=UPI00244AE11B